MAIVRRNTALKIKSDGRHCWAAAPWHKHHPEVMSGLLYEAWVQPLQLAMLSIAKHYSIGYGYYLRIYIYISLYLSNLKVLSS